MVGSTETLKWMPKQSTKGNSHKIRDWEVTPRDTCGKQSRLRKKRLGSYYDHCRVFTNDDKRKQTRLSLYIQMTDILKSRHHSFLAVTDVKASFGS